MEVDIEIVNAHAVSEIQLTLRYSEAAICHSQHFESIVTQHVFNYYASLLVHHTF